MYIEKSTVWKQSTTECNKQKETKGKSESSLKRRSRKRCALLREAGEMAVKQNNTEANATPSIASKTQQNASTATKSNMPSTQKKNKLDTCDVTNEDTDYPISFNVNSDELMDHGRVNEEEDEEEERKINNISQPTIKHNSISLDLILRCCHALENEPLYFQADIMDVYTNLLLNLSYVEVPTSPQELQNFKQNIQKVGAFFAKTNDKQIFLIYLQVVYQIISTAEPRKPSCALAIIFQIFNIELVYEAVQYLLSDDVADESLRKTLAVLCDWLRECTFCTNINYWIVTILTGLLDMQKWKLIETVALENIEKIFNMYAFPKLQPKAIPVVLQMLYTIKTPHVFHKVLQQFPFVISALKKQGAKDLLQQLASLCFVLMNRFDKYNYKYTELRNALNGLEHSHQFEYLPYCGTDWSGVENSLPNKGRNIKAGLTNLGNTCYMNSVLQALANTRHFSRNILLSQSPQSVLIKMKQQIALMLYSPRDEITPTRILNATRPSTFLPGLQQDSSEFLSHLLELLHEQEVGTTTQRLNEAKSDDTDSCGDDNETAEAATGSQVLVDSTAVGDSPTPEQSTIEKTFAGKLATTFRCLTCGCKSIKLDSFRDLQLSFPEMESDCASNYSVQDLIDYYCSPEKMYGENQYFCERCGSLSDAERYINFITAPKNLILTLKHFKYDQKYHMRAKLMHKVFHDEKLIIKVCTEQTTEEIATVHYDLYAGVVHSGYSMDSGHYYTYAADANNQWYKYNDNIVTPSKTEDIHNLTAPNTPYILFYQMSASTLNATQSTADNDNLVKVQSEPPLLLEQLPNDLRDYIVRDRYAYTEEVIKLHIYRNARNASRVANKPDISRGDGYDDDGGNNDDDPPPTSGCGDNAINFDANRYVF